MSSIYQKFYTYIGTEVVRGLSVKSVILLLGALAALALFFPQSASATSTATYIEFNDAVQSASDLTTYTFTNVDLGTPAADRCVIISAYGKKFGAASNLSSLTIGGATTTIIDVANGTDANTSIVALAAHELPTGATSTIVVTWANSMLRSGIGVWTGYGLESCTNPFQVASSTATDPTANLDIPEGGATVGVGVGDVSGAWSGLQEDFEAALEGSFTYSSGASDYGMATQTDRTITIDYASGAENAGIFVSWAAAISSASEVGPSPIEYLLVGGGGSGGRGNGFIAAGGGGAGGLVHASFTPSITTYTILVGRGGTAPTSQSAGENGNNTVLFGIGVATSTAFGGGGGGTGVGRDGGSGGGGYNTAAGGSGVVGQGNDGGTGTCNSSEVTDRNGSGGGGAGEAGFGCVDGAGVGGPGGDGLQISITGTPTYYAGGGGGGSRNGTAPAGGLGGGGNGAHGGSTDAQSGTDGLGGGGGGNGGAFAAGDGGDGVVILRWLTADYGTNCEADGGSETTDGDYTVCTFTSAGTLTVLPPGLVSGTLYDTDGTTAITTEKTISLVVGTSTPSVHTVTSDSTGYFIFFNIATSSIAATTSLTLFIDGDANDATTLVQGYAGSPITGVPLRYGHVLTLASSSAASVELTRFASYDRTDDSDILFVASSSPASTTIFATLLPYQGALVNTGGLTLTDSYIGSSTLSNTGTLVLSGTSKSLSGALTGSAALGDVSITGSYTASSSASTSALTIESGASFTAPTTTLTIDGSFTQNGSFDNASGTIYLSGSSPYNFNNLNDEIVGTFSVNSQDASPEAIHFSDDGLKMFILGDQFNSVHEYTLSTPYDIHTASFVDSFSVVGQDGAPTGFDFSVDGTKMYMIGAGSDSVHEYTLSVAWDISSASYIDSFSVASEDAIPTGIVVSNNGNAILVLGDNSDTIYHYAMTSFDVSTMFYTLNSLSFPSDDSGLEDLAISDDGLRLYVLGADTDSLYEYSLSSEFGIWDNTYEGRSVSTFSETSPSGITFSSEGEKLFIVGTSNDTVYAFDATTQHTGDFTGSNSLHHVVSADKRQEFIDEISVEDLTISASSTLIAPTGLTVRGSYNNEGTFDDNYGTVRFTGADQTIAGTLVGTSSFAQVEVSGSYAFTDSASTTKLTIESGGALTASTSLTISGQYQNDGTFTHGTGTVYFDGYGVYDTRQISFVDSFSISGEELTPNDVEFTPDGTRMFVMGSSGDDINQYSLSTAFDVSTASYQSTESVSGQENFPEGLAFSTDGLKMFVVGSTGDDVNEYTLTIPFTPSTKTFIDSFSVGTQETVPTDVAFSTDGLKMFVLGDAGDDINEYTLGAAFDVSTASFVDSFSVNTQETSPNGMAFSNDGLQVFVTGATGDDINEYVLATAWDISTASFVRVVSVIGQETGPEGIALSADGTKIFVIGTAGDDVNEYTIDALHSGTFVGASAFNDVVVADKTQTFLNSASTSDFIISASATGITTGDVVSVAGDYTNDGVLIASGAEFVFDGTSLQIATGTLTGTSSLADVTISNTSGAGSTTQSVTFGASLETTGTFTMGASTSAAFLAGATSTFAAINWNGGTAASPVWLRSTEPGTPWLLDVATQEAVSYVNVRDSDATLSSGGILTIESIDAGNNTNWLFSGSFTITGTLYEADGITPVTTGKTIALAVGTSTPSVHTTTSDGSGNFTFSNVNFVNLTATTPFTFYIDGDANDATTMVMGYQTYTSISNVPLWYEHVLTHAATNSASVVVTEFDHYDRTDDADILYTATTGSTTIHATLLPSFGTLYNAGQLTLEEHYIGSSTIDNPGTMVLAGTGKSLSGTLTGTAALGNVIIIGSYSASSSASTSAFTIESGGSFTTPTTSLTIGGSLTQNGNLVASQGVVQFRGASFFDITRARYNGEMFSVGGQETNPFGTAFSTNGEKMFILGFSSDTIYAYDLSTPFDVSTASYNSESFSVGGQEGGPRGLAFSIDGSKVYVVGINSDTIYAYDLSTPFDVSTANYNSESFSVGGQESSPIGITFSPTGNKVFIIGINSDTIYAYDLSTPFDVSTASYNSESFSVAGQETVPRGIQFNTLGDTVFVVGTTNDTIYAYDLSTPFDVSTASYNSELFNVSNLSVDVSNLTFSTDGSKLFITSIQDTAVFAFDLPAYHSGNFHGLHSFNDVSILSGVHNFLSSASTSDVSIMDSATMIAPTTTLDVSGSFENLGSFEANRGQVLLSGAGTVSGSQTSDNAFHDLTVTGSYTDTTPTAITGNYFVAGTMGRGDNILEISGTIRTGTSFVASSSVATEDINPTGLAFSADGTKMFVVGFTGQDVNEYTLTTAFDISTASFVDSFSVSAQETAPYGVAFSLDGQQMFVVGDTGNDINEYSLSIPYDVSTASFVQNRSVSGVETTPQGVAFSPDGTKMFVVGIVGDDVNEFTLGTPWDISSASFVDSFSVATEDAGPRSVTFTTDGTKMFILGDTTDAVYEYNLTNAFDVSTASLLDSFSVATEETFPIGLALSPDATQLFVVGINNDNVNAYSISTQLLSGNLVADSSLGNVLVSNFTPITIANNASTTDLTIEAAATLFAPEQLSVVGTLDNSGTYSAHATGTLYLTGTGEIATGTLVAASALGNVDITGSYIFGAAASTSDLTIRSGGSLTAPLSSLTINGDFTQGGTFTNNSGTQYFTGPNPELTGTLTGASALGDTILAPSSDAASWSVLAPVGSNDSWEAVTYGSSTFVAVATSNGDRVMYSYNGLDWATTTAAGNNDNWNDVTYGSGLFVAVSGSGDRVMTSSDGITWATTTAAGNDDDWQAVTFGNGRFVAVGLGPTRIMYSSNGTNWTTVSALGDNDNWRDVIYADGKFVAVGSSGDYVMYSSDGTNWTAGDNSLSGLSWNSVAYGNGTFVAVGDFGDRVATSPDGITWTERSVLSDDDSWNDVIYGNGYFVAVGRAGDRVMRSADGITWEAISVAGNDDNWRSVAYGDGMYVVVGYVSASDSLMVSQGAMTLTENASTTNFTIAANRTVTASTSLTELSVAGNYTNNGTFTSGSSTVYFSGTSLQTATGTLSGDSAFYDLTITNTSGTGSTTQSVTFNAPVQTTGTFTMGASTSAAFLAGATSTFARINWDGLASESPVWLRSTDPGTPWLLDADTQVAVSYVNVRDSDATPSTETIFATDSIDAGNNTNWFLDELTLALTNHPAGQVNNVFSFKNRTDAAGFAFELAPSATTTVTTLTLTVSGIHKSVSTTSIPNIRLFADNNDDATFDGGDTELSTGFFTITGESGTIEFTTDFDVTATTSYLVIFDTDDIDSQEILTLSLPASGIETTATVSGSVSSVQHLRNTQGSRGASGNAPGSIGGDAPAGDGDVGGGSEDGGGGIGEGGPEDQNIVPNVNFFAPSSTGDPDNNWTNPTNVYASDGVDATSGSNGQRQSYGGFGFNIPSTNQITGIEVKLDASDQIISGNTVNVSLSGDSGSTDTETKNSGELEFTDRVVILGGPSDLWGDTWSPADFSDTNFRVIIESSIVFGSVQVDALEVRVYHQATGGGGGGGGSI